MGVKIINVLKDDSFNDILELFRQAPAGEVILVLPRVCKLFRKEDHFAAFAAEATQGNKTISVLTANPDIAHSARTFGFAVIPTAPAKTRSTAVASKKKTAALATQPPPADPDTMDFNDTAPASDAENNTPRTSDETMDDATPAEPVITEPAAELDYIEAMWRDKTGKQALSTPAASFTFSRAARIARSTALSKRITLGILGATIIVFGAAVYILTGSAHVTLTPVSTPLNTQITVQASDVFSSIDDTFAKIPGQLLEVSKTASNTIAATGERDVASKARGTITVYNEYSSSPQTLVATTRFKSADGKIFRTLQTITVPGSTVKSGTMLPGTTAVQVVADKPGTDYNIPAGSFVIAAFQEKGDAEKAEKFYGKSTAPMSGGASGPSAVVTQENYDTAKDAAIATVKDLVRAAIEAQGPTLTVLNADALEMKTPESTARPDDAASDVTVTVEGKLKTIGFRKTDLLELISKIVLNKEHLVVLPETIKLSYQDIAFRADLGVLTFTVSIEGTGYAPIDTVAVKNDIIGKNQQQIREYFNGREGVLSAMITLSPFWVRSVPQDPKDTAIDILYEQGGSSR